MSDSPAAAHSPSWWNDVIPRANRVYFVATAVATLAVFLLPRVLGRFVPCARYMEVDWLLVALLSMTGIGVLNVLFSFVALCEEMVPEPVVTPLRKTLVLVLPTLALVGIVWFAVGTFIPVLANNPEVLCD